MVPGEHFVCTKENLQVTSGMVRMGEIPNIYNISQKNEDLYKPLHPRCSKKRRSFVLIFAILSLKSDINLLQDVKGK